MNVFVLYFVGPTPDGHWHDKSSGVFSSQSKAAPVIERLQSRPYFGHYPKAFQVECVRLDEEYDRQAEAGPAPPNPPIPPV